VWGFARAETATRIRILAMLLLAAPGYLAVAFGRSAFTFGLPLSWVATQARYHYASSIPIVLAVAMAAVPLCTGWRHGSRYRTAALSTILLIWGVSSLWITFHLDRTRNDPPSPDAGAYVAELEARLQRAVRAEPALRVLYVVNERFTPVEIAFLM